MFIWKEFLKLRQHSLCNSWNWHALVWMVWFQRWIRFWSELRGSAFVRYPLIQLQQPLCQLDVFDQLQERKPTALGACIGAVVGLVAITPAAGYVSIGSSVLIGILASMVSNIAVHWKTKSSLDDTLDVFPCHGWEECVG
jgi:hypothetical protein